MVDIKYIFAAILVAIIVICIFVIKKEHITLAEPTFYDSVLADERAHYKDKRGLAVNDLLLESQILTKRPISSGRRLM